MNRRIRIWQWLMLIGMPLVATAGQGEHAHGTVDAGQPVPAVDIQVTRDRMQGWNLHVMTKNFRFAPQSASGPHRPGEGHAHVYVDGRKLARLYGAWFHLAELAQGRREVRVSLNANDHRTYTHAGRPIEARVFIDVQAGMGHQH